MAAVNYGGWGIDGTSITHRFFFDSFMIINHLFVYQFIMSLLIYTCLNVSFRDRDGEFVARVLFSFIKSIYFVVINL